MRQIVIGVLLLLLLTACNAQTTERLQSLEAQVNDISELEERLAALEEASQLEEEQAVNPMDIPVAQYVMDTADFHGIDESLNETKEVDPGCLRDVRRVDKVLSHTPWPDALQVEATALLTLLDEFAVALEADDGEEAARLATEVHEAQHDFSQSIDGWLGEGEDEH